MNNNTIQYKYLKWLKQFTADYDGDFQKVIQDSHNLFYTLCELPNSSKLEYKDKRIILNTLGYFLMSRDVLSEEIFGPIGLIEDIFLTLHCLRYIRKKYSFDKIMDFWNKDYKILIDYLDNTYFEIQKNNKYKKYCTDVLKYISI